MFIPPEEGLPRRWLKALLYLAIGAGLGDAELDDAIAFSEAACPVLRPEAATDGGGMCLGSELGALIIGRERGEAPRGGSMREGEAESGGALNGWNEIEGRLRGLGLASAARAAARPVGAALTADKGLLEAEGGGDGDDVTYSLAARRADMGLAPVGGPT